MRPIFPLIALVCVVGAAVACKEGGSSMTSPSVSPTAGLAACGSSTSLFNALPVAQSNIGGWVPLGALNPSGHTFPTDHQYIYLKTFGSGTVPPVELYAPGTATIVMARRTQYLGPAPYEDYSLMFSTCRETYVEFGHVRTITPAILAKIPPFDQGCSAYSPAPGQSVNACWTKPAEVSVNAGDVIGTTAGLDLSLFDSRVTPLVFANPTRWGGMTASLDHFHVVPFSDYYAEPMRSTVQSMLGSYDGKVKRTIPPLGGTIGTDVAGTVQGTWFFGSEPTYPEYPHLAIVPDHVTPTRINISMGVSGGTFTSGMRAMVPSASGPFNVHPSQITPGTTVHCWDLINGFDFGTGYGVALIQLVDATTLKIEGRLGPQYTCANQQPAAFTAAAVTYRR